MIKSARRIETVEGHNLFGFADIMENENESSHQSSYHRENDDFADFLSKANELTPSPVNRRPQKENGFFDFEQTD